MSERSQARMEKEDREMVEDLTAHVYEWPRYLDVLSDAVRNILEVYMELEEETDDEEMAAHYREGRVHMEKILKSNENTKIQYYKFHDSESSGAL